MVGQPLGGWGEKKHVTGSERKRPWGHTTPGRSRCHLSGWGASPALRASLSHLQDPRPPDQWAAGVAQPIQSGAQPRPHPRGTWEDPRGDTGGPLGKQSQKAGCRQVPSLSPYPGDRWGNEAQSCQPAGARAGCGALGRCVLLGHTSTLGAVPAQSLCAQPGPAGLSPAPWPPGPRPARRLSQRPHGHPSLSRASSSPAKGAGSLGGEVLGTRPWKGPSPTCAETLLTHLRAAQTPQMPRSSWHRLSRPQVAAGSAGPGRGGRWVGPGGPPSPAGLPAELQAPVPASQPSRGGPGGPTPAGRSLLLPGRTRVLVTLAPTSAPRRGTATSISHKLCRDPPPAPAPQPSACLGKPTVPGEGSSRLPLQGAAWTAAPQTLDT